jgi:hypothetical protein
MNALRTFKNLEAAKESLVGNVRPAKVLRAAATAPVPATAPAFFLLALALGVTRALAFGLGDFASETGHASPPTDNSEPDGPEGGREIIVQITHAISSRVIFCKALKTCWYLTPL